MKAKPKSRRPNNGGNSKSGKVNTHQLKPNRVKRVRPLAPQQFVDIIEHMNDGLVVLDKELAVSQKPLHEETTCYRMYNETLIRKLEDKMLQPETVRRAWEGDIIQRK